MAFSSSQQWQQRDWQGAPRDAELAADEDGGRKQFFAYNNNNNPSAVAVASPLPESSYYYRAPPLPSVWYGDGPSGSRPSYGKSYRGAADGNNSNDCDAGSMVCAVIMCFVLLLFLAVAFSPMYSNEAANHYYYQRAGGWVLGPSPP